MKLIVVLKKRDLGMARAEACALFGAEPLFERENFLVLETNRPSLMGRLSQSSEVLLHLLSSPVDETKERLGMVSWEDHYKRSFCVRAEGTPFSSQELAGVIWNALPSPAVDLKNPGTRVMAYGVQDTCLVGITKWRNEDTGRERRPDRRPFHHPSSLDPALARCMVNLTGRRSGTIIDPFCGSGGILIEAGLMGFSIEGYDIEPEMVAGCKKNLAHLGLKGKIFIKDSLTLDRTFSSVVTDLPYAKNTKGKEKGLDMVYKRFFSLLARRLQGRAVVGMPSHYSYLDAAARLTVIYDFEWYIHKSMTKRILVLEKETRRPQAINRTGAQLVHHG